MTAEEELRSEKIKRQLQLKLDSIAEFSLKMRRKRNKIIKFHERNASEEKTRFTERMSQINARMETHVLRAKEALSARKMTLEQKNSQVFVTLDSTRNKTHDDFEKRIQVFEQEQE